MFFSKVIFSLRNTGKGPIIMRGAYFFPGQSGRAECQKDDEVATILRFARNKLIDIKNAKGYDQKGAELIRLTKDFEKLLSPEINIEMGYVKKALRVPHPLYSAKAPATESAPLASTTSEPNAPQLTTTPEAPNPDFAYDAGAPELPVVEEKQDAIIPIVITEAAVALEQTPDSDEATIAAPAEPNMESDLNRNEPAFDRHENNPEPTKRERGRRKSKIK